MARRLFTLLATAILVINSVKAAPVRRGAFDGDATFFSVGLGACGGTNTNDDLICALVSCWITLSHNTHISTYSHYAEL